MSKTIFNNISFQFYHGSQFNWWMKQGWWVPEENYRTAMGHSQTLYYKVILSTIKHNSVGAGEGMGTDSILVVNLTTI